MTAQDDKDGDLTSEVFVEKVVPVSKKKAVVYYGVTDKAKNVGTASQEVIYQEIEEGDVAEETAENTASEDVSEDTTQKTDEKSAKKTKKKSKKQRARRPLKTRRQKRPHRMQRQPNSRAQISRVEPCSQTVHVRQ